MECIVPRWYRLLHHLPAGYEPRRVRYRDESRHLTHTRPHRVHTARDSRAGIGHLSFACLRNRGLPERIKYCAFWAEFRLWQKANARPALLDRVALYQWLLDRGLGVPEAP